MERRLAWHPSLKPRLPRIRAAKRRLGEWGGGRQSLAPVYPCLTNHQTQSLVAHLPIKGTHARLSYLLELGARQHARWRAGPEFPRAVPRHQLRMLAHAAWQMRDGGPARARYYRDLVNGMRDLIPETKARLLNAIEALTDDGVAPIYHLYGPERLNSELILKAAKCADRGLKGGGDYADLALASSTAYLVLLWNLASGAPPVVSRTRVGAMSRDGSFSTVTASDCGKFVLSFFQIVGPQLSPRTITNALEARLSYMRKHGLGGLDRQRKDVVNLLDRNHLG